MYLSTRNMVKGKLLVCLIKYHTMQKYGETHSFAASALDWSEWLASRLGNFTPGERTPDGWASGRRIIDENPWPCWKWNPVRPDHSIVTILIDKSPFLLNK